MADGAALLRMLEPTVRPVPTAGGGASRPAPAPFEERSFDALLAEKQQSGEGEAPADAARPAGPEPTAALRGLERIDNASIRQLIARQQENV